jgi:hypothetical protein
VVVQENVTEMEINYSKCGDGFSEQTATATDCSIERFPKDNRSFLIEHIPPTIALWIIVLLVHSALFACFYNLAFLSPQTAVQLVEQITSSSYCQGRQISTAPPLLLRGTFQDCRPSAFL